MSDDSRDATANTDLGAKAGAELVVPLLSESASITHREAERAVVRIETVTRAHEQLIDEPVTREHVEIEHVPVGRYVDAIPATREEGDVTIVPVIEEVIVVERKLMLREEIRIRRVRRTDRHRETVELRKQEALVTRTPVNHQPASNAEPSTASRRTNDD